ncbi:MAG: accessory gene regulator ArgB-like protein [Candidatus Fimenecus sp.]
MISNLSKRLVSYLIKQNTIDEVDRELYVYGFFVLLSNLFYFCLSLAAGLLCGIWLESLLFFAAFLCIRQFAGGHHAKTEQRCQFFSSVSILICIFLIRLSMQNDFRIPYSIAFAIAASVILLFAPLDTPEKRLSPKEKKKYRTISYVILAVLTTVFAGGIIGSAAVLYSPIGAAVCFEGVLMAYGKTAQVYRRTAE